jgi:hypothetical protein
MRYGGKIYYVDVVSAAHDKYRVAGTFSHIYGFGRPGPTSYIYGSGQLPIYMGPADPYNFVWLYIYYVPVVPADHGEIEQSADTRIVITYTMHLWHRPTVVR